MTDTTLPPTATRRPADASPPTPDTTTSPWDRTLAVLAAVVAVIDLAILSVIGLVPPVLVLGVLGLVGVAVLRRRPTAGRVTLLVVSLVGVVGALPFSAEALAHPKSPVDFIHALTSLPLRVVVIIAAVTALRRASTGGAARTTRRVALGALAVLSVASIGVSLTGSSAAVAADDVVLAAEGVAFVGGDQVTVAAGDRLVIDNRDLLRHTFTVEGTAVDVELPARRAVAVAVDLAPGTYPYLCAVPGHESMTGTLTVTG